MKRAGSALIMVSTLASLLLLAALASSVLSISNMGLTTEEKMRTQLELACESGLARAKTKIEESFADENIAALQPDIIFTGTREDDTFQKAEDKVFDDESYNLGSGSDDSDNYSFIIENDNGPDITVKYAITTENEGSLNWFKKDDTRIYPMNLSCIAYAPKAGLVAMQQQAIARRSNLFNHQVFFQNDLEILPGPNFDLKGLIHTNENMYLGAGNKLTIKTDELTAAGQIFRNRLDRDESSGTVEISSEDENGVLKEMMKGSLGSRYDADNPEWVNVATNTWKGTVRDKSLGAKNKPAPKLKSFEPGGYYDSKAGLKIEVITSSGKPVYEITYKNQSGITVPLNETEKNKIRDALSETKIWDQRESTSTPVKLTQVNVEKLKQSGYYPPNGMLYMTRDDAKPDSNPDDAISDSSRVVSGFKLYSTDVNGNLKNTELPQESTFISNLPMYIHGDFNKHTTTNDKWKASAVIADAVNILSKNWKDPTDLKKPPSYTNLKATETTVDTVFITGNTKTVSGDYNGGLENFIRFHEDWSNIKLNITGGFIQLFRSRYASGRWKNAKYGAPTRNWKSETNFDSVPPGYADLFPSSNEGIVYSGWKQVSKKQIKLKECE